MSNIQTFLQNILSARYGKDVRQSIHDAIKEVDRVADTAQGSATEAAEIAVNSATEAEQYRNEAKQYRDEAVAVAGVEFATTEKAGLVKPDGETILIDPDGTIHSVGGSGTVNYEELENKPSINGVELSGNLTTEDLNIDLGTVDYTELENKPSINGTELEGNKTLDDLGIASKTELEKTTYKVDTVIAHTDLGIKETAIGEEIHLTDSAEGKAVEFALFGKARQDGEPTPENPIEIEVAGESYNLLPYPYYETNHTDNTVVWVDNGNGTVTANGTASPNSSMFLYTFRTEHIKAGKYIISGCPKGGSKQTYYQWFGLWDGSANVYSDYDIGDGIEVNVTEEQAESCTIVVAGYVYSGATVENLVFKPMIRKASVKNDRYMPFGAGSVEVASCGKNYYDINKTASNSSALLMDISENSIRLHNTSEATFVGTKFVLDPTKIKIGKTYTFSADVTYTSGSGRLVLRTKDGVIKTGTNIIKTSGRYMFTFVMQEGGDYLTLFCTGSTKELGDVTYSNIQLEEGEAITEYEPYKESISTIPTENGLAGIKVSSGGNYTDSNGQQWICDEVVKYADGSGDFIQRIGKVVFDGSADEGWATSNTNDTAKKRMNTRSMRNYIKKVESSTIFNGMSNIAISNSSNNTWRCVEGVSADTVGDVFVYSENYNTDDVSLWTSYLTDNPMILYYELAEPITTPLTAEELAEISTFYPVTNITNDFDCGMKVKYKVDAKNYIDSKLSQIATAMINNI